MPSEDSLRSAHLSATGGIALRPWHISASTTYQSLQTPSQPSTPSGAYGTPISSIPNSSLFANWKHAPPTPPAMPLYAEKEIEEQWTPIAGPNNRPLGDSFNTSISSIAAHNTSSNTAPAPPPVATIEVESTPPVFEESVPATQIPTGTPELYTDMSDNVHELEIIQEHPNKEESPDNKAIMGPPPNEPHAYAPDKYDYLYQVPEECETSSFLAYSIADNSMRSHNSTMGPLMAIGKMVETLCGTVRALATEVATLRAEIKTLSQPTTLPAQPKQHQQQSNKGKGKMTYAAAAASNTTSPIPPAPTPKKKAQEKLAPLYRPQYTKKSREIMVDLLAPLPATITDLQILTTVNKAVHPQKFSQARRSLKGNIMLLTPPKFAATDTLKLSSRIVDALSDLGVNANTPHINSRWSQFIIHGVPTQAPSGGDVLDEIAENFEDVVPGMKLAQRPRWLSSPANREGKESSSIVISLAEQVTLENL
ncbi:hypothetical protein Q9L58_010460 [Maublancomyces gigas]|uniref:Uncharacterized protein n=1 Tax=Discina gigas TaxID=1032678 RepID=A0ABR3G4F8_9PEZI